MKSPLPFRRRLLAMSVGLFALPAFAKDDCDTPVDRWQTREAVRQMAAAQGWRIQRLKIDDGCYEIRGTDAQGRGFKAKVDPETLKVLKIKPSDDRRSRERDHEDAARRPPPDRAPESSPLPPAGSRPGQIE